MWSAVPRCVFEEGRLGEGGFVEREGICGRSSPQKAVTFCACRARRSGGTRMVAPLGLPGGGWVSDPPQSRGQVFGWMSGAGKQALRLMLGGWARGKESQGDARRRDAVWHHLGGGRLGIAGSLRSVAVWRAAVKRPPGKGSGFTGSGGRHCDGENGVKVNVWWMRRAGRGRWFSRSRKGGAVAPEMWRRSAGNR